MLFTAQRKQTRPESPRKEHWALLPHTAVLPAHLWPEPHHWGHTGPAPPPRQLPQLGTETQSAAQHCRLKQILLPCCYIWRDENAALSSKFNENSILSILYSLRRHWRANITNIWRKLLLKCNNCSSFSTWFNMTTFRSVRDRGVLMTSVLVI